MKKIVIIAGLTVLLLWYALGVMMTLGYGGKLGPALLWPFTKIRNWFAPKPTIATDAFVAVPVDTTVMT